MSNESARMVTNMVISEEQRNELQSQVDKVKQLHNEYVNTSKWNILKRNRLTREHDKEAGDLRNMIVAVILIEAGIKL